MDMKHECRAVGIFSNRLETENALLGHWSLEE